MTGHVRGGLVFSDIIVHHLSFFLFRRSFPSIDCRWWLRVGEERGGVSRSLEECTKNMTNTHHMNTCRRCVRVVCTKGVYKR
mmetsp:Transcript_13651/g.38419  ORF Transcript_13651/g.38419 Transcript_13651/m.38419 type:complete len:82 (+) Transcript_13651:1183-1428(+)